MKKYHLVFIIFIFLSLIGCEKNTEGSAQLDVNFKLEYNEAPLVFLSDVSYPDGRTMIFNRVSFFLSEVTLIKGNISSTSDDVKMVNFNASNGSLASALMGETVQFAGFEENDYSQIRICIGVDKKNNAKDPSKFSNTHPLSNQSEYWAAWNSYIFFRAEGFLDSNRDGTKNLGFALHTGADDAYRCITLPINIDVKENQTNKLSLTLDAKKIFGTNPIYDINQNPQLHSLSQLPQVIQIADNIKNAFTID